MIALFDIGSTLIDGPPYGPARRLAEMLGLGKAAVLLLEHLLFRTPSEGPEDLARCVADKLGVDPTLAYEACATLWNAQLSEAYVLPGAAETIAKLAKAGVSRAYLSNIWPPFYEHFRRSFEKESANPQFLSFQMGLMKPDPQFFREALRRLAVPPGEVVMIGDTYKNDIRPAIELGMKTVWVLHRPDKERASLVDVVNGIAPRPDVTIGAIGELRLEHLYYEDREVRITA
ncbi:MAG: HAD-IA family hydrolase [Acidobacteriota bacterium]